jgi:hypothetical protein
VDSDYRCGDCLQRRTYGSRASVGVPANFVSKRGPAGVVVSGNTRLVVQGDYSLPGAVLADFAPLGLSVVLLPADVAAEGRLEL